MAARDGLPVALFVTRRKLLSAKANFLVLGGFLLLLALVWIKGAFIFSFRLFLFLFPHLFLFQSQDMFRDEVDSGALENLLFAGEKYKSYLGWKNGVVGAAALGMGLILFAVFSIYGITIHQFAAGFLLQFGAGVLAGLYYQALSGCLSFVLKAGSNVLVVVLGQALALFGLLLSAAQRPEWLERLASSPLPGWAARLEVMAFTIVVPNIIVVRRSWWSILGVGVLAGLFFSLQLLNIRAMELRK